MRRSLGSAQSSEAVRVLEVSPQQLLDLRLLLVERLKAAAWEAPRASEADLLSGPEKPSRPGPSEASVVEKATGEWSDEGKSR